MTFRRMSPVVVLALGLMAVPALAQGTMSLVRSLEKGAWDVRYRDGAKSQRICVKSGRELIQLRHPGADCRHIEVGSDATRVTVQYTCRGNGYGRTSIRRETSGLVQLQGQGIADGVPFDFTAEARRVGSC